MKSPHIWIIIALLLLVIGMIVFWPSPEPDTTQAYKRQIAKDQEIKRDLQQKLSQTLARIRTDSLHQAIQDQDHKKHTDSLKSRINDLKRKPRVVYIRETEPAIDSLITYQDSLLLVQRARIDTLTVNLSDLRVDLQSVTENFEAQLAANDRIIENQGQILNQKDKEIRKHRREKRLAIIGGIVATVAALLVR